jgi:methylenetetrahydrofolate--tRNA-(uracil-5-)-methyltransferase
MGLLAGINAARFLRGMEAPVPPETTAIGALVHYITEASPEGFQPMNVNFGIFPPLAGRIRKTERRQRMAQRALEDLEGWCKKWK